LFKEKIHRNHIIAILVALVGLLFITGRDFNALSESARFGILFGFGTAVFYSGYILLIKSAMNYQEVSGITAMFIVSVTCTGFFSIVTPLTGASFVIPDLTSLLALLGAGVICTTIGWSFISSAIKLTSATIASLFLLLQPALAFVWDVFFFSRPTEYTEIGGVLLVLSAIYIGSYRQA
jgi:drug/metabolite transporter (DMT)-like permease